jgi:hypothetical protein
VHAFLDELLALVEQLASEEDDTSGAVTNFIVLRLGDINESLGSGVNDIKKLDDSSAII